MNFILYRIIEHDVRHKSRRDNDSRFHEKDGYLISPKETYEKVDLSFWKQVHILSGQSISPEVVAELTLDEIEGEHHEHHFHQNLLSASERFDLILRMSPYSPQLHPAINPAHAGSYSPIRDVYILHKLIPNREDRMKLLEIYETLQGRKLTLKEVLKYLHENDLADYLLSPHEILQLGYLIGAIEWVSPFSEGVCKRCGYGSHTPFLSSINSPTSKILTSIFDFTKHLLTDHQLIPFNCARCQKTCYYCPNCMQLGVLQSCVPLAVGINLPLQMKQINSPQQTVKSTQPLYLNWNGTYTKLQQKAVDELECFLREIWNIPTNMDLFYEYVLWAVCGAGKTELVYPAIELALQMKKKILLTSPRKDVILELAPRIKTAFPTVDVTVLYAESEEKFSSGQIILATSHQVMRFEQAFDFIIIDEEDAFPFSTERELHHAIRSAMTSAATIVYVTATPSPLIMKRIKKELIPYSRISERYHGHPLAIPEPIPIGNWRKSIKRGEIISQLLDFVLHIFETKRQAFLFVPHVHDVKLVQTYLQDVLLPYIKEQKIEQIESVNFNSVSQADQGEQVDQLMVVEGVYAQHAHRIDTIKRFRAGEVQLLVTTSILERGVTIPYSDCAILGSDEAVFSTAALIQMAGRVGRKLEDPIGQVWFFPGVRTVYQMRAIKTIKDWNEEAKRLRC